MSLIRAFVSVMRRRRHNNSHPKPYACARNCEYSKCRHVRYLLSSWGLCFARLPRITCTKKVEQLIKDEDPQKPDDIRLGMMSGCLQPPEEKRRIFLDAINLMNKRGFTYTIVTESHHIADKEFLKTMDKKLAKIQIDIQCLDDEKAKRCESNKIPPSMRVAALLTLQEAGFNVALGLYPLIEEHRDFDKLNELHIDKCVVGFCGESERHLPFDEKLRLVNKIKARNITVYDNVADHQTYWHKHYDTNYFGHSSLTFREV